MKISYQFNEFNYFQNYYFFDGEKYFEVSKDISKEDYRELNSKYYQKVNLPIYEYLFENKKFPYNNDFYKFLAVDLELVDSDSKSSLINFLRDLFDNVDIFDLKNKTICIYDDKFEFNLKSIFIPIIDDLGLNIKTYESGKISNKAPEGFKILFESYLKFSYKSSRLYTNNSDLILDIARADMDKLKLIKPYILNRVYNDTQLEILINSLFNNNLNVTKTAKDVYMHRNTINNKLDFIREETTLSLQKFKDAVAMYLLIKS